MNIAVVAALAIWSEANWLTDDQISRRYVVICEDFRPLAIAQAKSNIEFLEQTFAERKGVRDPVIPERQRIAKLRALAEQIDREKKLLKGLLDKSIIPTPPLASLRVGSGGAFTEDATVLKVLDVDSLLISWLEQPDGERSRTRKAFITRLKTESIKQGDKFKPHAPLFVIGEHDADGTYVPVMAPVP